MPLHWLYQDFAEPIIGANTLDQWWRPFAEPVRVKPFIAAAIIASGLSFVPEPVAPAEVIEADKWYQQLSRPVPPQFLHPAYQPAAFDDAELLTQPEQPQLDKWYVQLSIPPDVETPVPHHRPLEFDPLPIPPDTSAVDFASAYQQFGLPAKFQYKFRPVPDDPNRARLSSGGGVVVWLALDSLHGDYAGVTGALLILSTVDAAHDANMKLVTAIQPASREGALAPIDPVNLGIGVYKDEYIHAEDFAMRGLAYIGGDPGGQAVEYVRPQQGDTPTSDNYNVGDGSSFGDAYNGPLDPAINGGTNEEHQVGTTYFYCDGDFWNREDGSGNNPFVGAGGIQVADATGVAPIIIRCDYPNRPGLVTGDWTWNGRGTDLGWVVHSGDVYRRGDFGGEGRTVFASSILQKDADPTVSATQLLEHYLIKADSLATISAGKFWTEGMAKVAVDAAIGDEGGVFTDYTTAANEDTADDVVIFADGAVNGDAFYVGHTDLYSTVFQVGGSITGFTGVLEYSQGSDTWGTLADISDLSNTFKTFGNAVALNDGRLTFNYPSDWATDTVNSQGPYYYIRLRKTAGTVSGIQDKTRLYVADTTLYVQRQDLAAVTRANEPFLARGLRAHYWEMNGEGNFELINVRCIDCQEIFNNFKNSTDITYSGGQYIGLANTLMEDSGLARRFHASGDGRVFYDVSDREINSKHAYVDDLVDRWSSDRAVFADMDRWCDFVYSDEGIYANNAGVDPNNISGMYVRHIGDKISNSVGEVFDNADAGDHHSLAIRGGYNGGTTGDVWERFCLEYVSSAINIYQAATGGGDAPAFGSGSGAPNMTLRDFLIVKSNGVEDLAQPLAGIVFNGDNDLTLYDDDTGDHSGITCTRFYIAGLAEQHNLNNGVPDCGHAIVNALDQTVVYDKFTVDGCNWIWANARAGQLESASAVIREDNDGGPSFVDLTNDVKDTGATAVNFFPAVEGANDACYFAVKRQSFRKIRLNITTAAVGTHVLAFEEWTGSSWDAVSGLTDDTNDLTTAGTNTITWTRNDAMATTTVNSQGPFYYFRIRLVSGSFTTDPVFDECRTRDVGANSKMHNWHFRNMVHGLGWERSGTIGISSAVMDVDNYTGELRPGQTLANTALFKRGGSNPPNPALTLTQHKALIKSRANTDAVADSVFSPNVSETPGVHITETELSMAWLPDFESGPRSVPMPVEYLSPAIQFETPP